MTDFNEARFIYPFRTEKMIGREEIREKIRAACFGDKNELTYIHAGGGTGKTRLLEETFFELGCVKGFRCSGIIDMYQSEFHDPDKVQFAIAQQIDPKNHYFQGYREKRNKYLSAKEEGEEGKPLAELAEQRDRQFMEDYQDLAAKERIILILDTTENIQFEDEDVQSLCEIDEQALVIETWLIERASLFENTVILMAGRQSDVVEKEILPAFENRPDSRWLVERCELSQLNDQETYRYIDAILEQNPKRIMLDDEKKAVLYTHTQGNPIRLAMALQLIFQNGYDVFYKRLLIKKSLDEVLKDYLSEFWASYKDILNFMFLARKGMDCSLLKHLTGASDAEVDQMLEEMSQIILVKPRKDGKQLFLHDALYDLYDEWFSQTEDRFAYYQQFAQYYEQKEKDLKSYVEKLENRAIRLYYELQWHVAQGYILFERWEDEVIYLHMTDIDMRMNNELLRFLHRYADEASRFYNKHIADQIDRAAIDRANTARWVDRYFRQGKYQKISRVAKQIRQADQNNFRWDQIDDPIYKAHLLITWALNEIYLSHDDLVISLLKEAREVLDGYQPKQSGKEEEKSGWWWKTRLMGTISYNSGYFNRKNGRYAKAMAQYRSALIEFQKINVNYLRGQTLTNYAYLLSVTGNARPAKILIHDAINIWKEMDMTYRLSLSLNTLSLILCEDEKPRAGRTEAEKARQNFLHLGEKRGEALAMIALGRAERRLGNMWKGNLEEYPIDKASENFQRGLNWFLKANIIADQLGETMIDWELHNELGSLFCDWAWLDRAQGLSLDAENHYLESIKEQIEALNIAQSLKMPFQMTDSLIDLAQVYGDQSFFEFERNNLDEYSKKLMLAHQGLEEAEKTVPNAYWKPGREEPFEHEDGQPYWLLLGKTNLWRGVWAFRVLEYSDSLSLEECPDEIQMATKHLLRSLAYLRSYGDDTPPQERSLTYLTEFVRKIEATSDWLKEPIGQVEQELGAPGLLTFVFKDIQPIMGI